MDEAVKLPHAACREGPSAVGPAVPSTLPCQCSAPARLLSAISLPVCSVKCPLNNKSSRIDFVKSLTWGEAFLLRQGKVCLPFHVGQVG